MGLLLSIVLAYAGVVETNECIKHILAGMLPENEPDFKNLVQHYTKLINKQANPSYSSESWIQEGGQGYLCLAEDKDGKLVSATVKYYDGSKPDSPAILFSTKISSFGQDSVDNVSTHSYGDCTNKNERYPTSTTKTLIANTSESFCVGQRHCSTTPSYENVSDHRFSPSSFEHSRDEPQVLSSSFERLDTVKIEKNYDNYDVEDPDEEDPPLDTRSQKSESKEVKLTWHYRPKSPAPSTLPIINLQTFDDSEKREDTAYSEDMLRSLDGIKHRPLQRSEQSGRRRSFKKRHSSSSTSSRESRASREEEVKMFTSLEEAEFEKINKVDSHNRIGSTSYLEARSISRSRSRENSRERRNDTWSLDASMDYSVDEDSTNDLKPKLKDLPKLSSFEEEKPEDTTAETELEKRKETEVIDDDDEEEVDDFWGSSGE